MFSKTEPGIGRGPRAPFSMRQPKGFTVVELLAVIVVVGVFAVVFSPRFFGLSEYRVITSKAELVSLGRFAQQAALARGTNIRVQLVLDTANREMRVETGPVGNACDATRVVDQVLRTIPMAEGVDFAGTLRSGLVPSTAPAGFGAIIQYDPLGAMDVSGTACPALASFDLDGPDRDFGDLCVEPSGYMHMGTCYCDINTGIGSGCQI